MDGLTTHPRGEPQMTCSTPIDEQIAIESAKNAANDMSDDLLIVQYIDCRRYLDRYYPAVIRIFADEIGKRNLVQQAIEDYTKLTGKSDMTADEFNNED
jgi:hypothetical protein